MTSEFEIIRRHFSRTARSALLGVGDDAALLRPRAGCDLVVSTDTLNEDVHFPRGTTARQVGHKALAVNLSDLAAMGATPRWALLAISLPGPDESWIAQFAEGFFTLADRFHVELIGGDTTRGPCSLTVTIMGELPCGEALLRSGAAAGDDIWVSGELGGAALGLACLQERATLQGLRREEALRRLHEPEPRVALGTRLRGLASAAIDVSDGFATDLGHLLERSRLGATVDYEALPRPDVFDSVDQATEAACVLAGGDDYELVFTAPSLVRESVMAVGRALGLRVSRVGTTIAKAGELHVLNPQGREMTVPRGFDHFMARA